jgi:hypothetical protein
VSRVKDAIRLRRARSTPLGEGWLVEGSLEYK